MKKEYIEPAMQVVKTELCQMLAGSGPGPGEQSNPGMSAPGYDSEDDDY